MSEMFKVFTRFTLMSLLLLSMSVFSAEKNPIKRATIEQVRLSLWFDGLDNVNESSPPDVERFSPRAELTEELERALIYKNN